MRFLRKKVPRHHHDMWKIKLEIRFASVKIGKIFFQFLESTFLMGEDGTRKLKYFRL